MDGRMKKYGQLSPERAKVWTEKSPKYQQQQPARLSNGKVPVVYYLCRNRQLEHPHFIEVPLSSTDGLYLRDVIERLNVLRGRGMASLYSWSCKRSYKNGFVWHDLCEEDLILPAHGNEYVLKGSELFDESDAGRFSPAGNVRLSNQKLLPEPQSSRSQDDTSSSSSMNEKGTKNSQDDESSPPVQRSGSSAVSPQSSSADKSSSWNGSLSLAEYKIYKNEGLADASTQTDENGSKSTQPETCTRGVSTDDGSIELGNNEIQEVQVQPTNESAQICRETVSPAPSSSSASSSGGRTDTLESLIRADINKLNSFRIIEGEEFRVPKTKLKPSNVLMQLISCGSISVKDHSFGLIPTYRPRFSHSKFPSPLFSTSLTLGDLDCLAENPKFMSLRLEDKEYFSGSLLETNMPKEPTLLKRSSSYNADRTNKEHVDSVEDKEEKSSVIKCIPRSIKATKELALATQNFREANLIGEGGFGSVYKGRLESGLVVAIKQLNLDGLQGHQEFIVEVLMLSLLHHKNLVNLTGYCTDGDQRLLIYEFMPMGSLENHLFDVEPGKKPLSWSTRLKIASGAAHGLEYLHCKANPPVIYRDLKSSNILLDNDFNPKLSDFGLAKLGPVGENTHVSTRVMGTYGYCAPEYAMSGKLTLKSDIYSLGVVLLELITGRKAYDNSKEAGEQNLVVWSRPFLKDRRKFVHMVDPLLNGQFSVRSLHHAVAITAMCIQEQASFRPIISDIVVALDYLVSQAESSDSQGVGSQTVKQTHDHKDN